MTVHLDRIAMLSIHSSPIGVLGTADTGGMSIYLLALSAEIGRRGIHVDIFTREVQTGGKTIIEYADNVRIISLPINGTSMLQKSELFGHLHNYRQAIQTFTSVHGLRYQLIHSNYWLSAIIGDWLRTRWDCPHVITFHTLGKYKVVARENHREDQQRLIEEVRLLRCCDGVIASTTHEQATMRAGIENRAAPVYLVPLGVDHHHFRPSTINAESLHADRAENPVVLFVGRFDPMKGAGRAIEALHLQTTEPDAELIIVGGDGRDSNEYHRLNRLVGELGMQQRIVFEGSVEYRNMPDYYQQADALLVSSYYESFGLVILEALASGVPVAATPVGIAKEIIQPGINGFLATDRSSPSLATALAQTLELAKHADKARIRHSVDGYSWSKVAGLTLDVYNEVLSGY